MNENYYIIRTGFDLSAIPDSVHIAVGNRAADADVEISECTVRYNRAQVFCFRLRATYASKTVIFLQ